MTAPISGETPPADDRAAETAANVPTRGDGVSSSVDDRAAARPVEASGDRAVAIGGSVTDSEIITGDGNVVTIDRRSIRIALQAGCFEIEVHVGARATDGTYATSIAIPTEDRLLAGTLTLPYSDLELRLGVAWIEQGAADDQVAQFGEQLFRALFTEETRRAYAAARSSELSVRLRFVFDSPDLNRVPWELLYDPARRELVAGVATVVRGAPGMSPSRPRRVLGPVRVLIADTLPRERARSEGLPTSSTVARALRQLSRRRQVEVETIVGATRASLERKLQDAAVASRPYHVVQIVGQAGLDPSTGAPVLLSPLDTAEQDAIDASTLAGLFEPYDVELVILSLVRSVQTPAFDVTTTFGLALLAGGVPAVIGMSVGRLSDTVGQALHELYDGIVRTRPVDEALRDAWQLGRDGPVAQSTDLGRPVCFLRPGSGQLLDVRVAEPTELGRAPRTWLPWLREHATATRIAIAACLLIVLLAALYILHEPIQEALAGPTPLKGLFNVAVTELRYDPTGCPSGVSPDYYSRIFHGKIDEGVKKISQQFDTGYYPAQTWKARDERGLAELGRAVDADAVVYGDLRCGLNDATIVPRVYLTNRRLGDRDAAELIGAHPFGPEIFVRGSLHDIGPADELLAKLTERTVLLAELLWGLSSYASGRWEAADQAFEKVVNGVAPPEAEAEEGTSPEREPLKREDGLAAMHLFRAKAATQRRNWSEAEEGYRAALRFKPDFPRAQLGLAEVEYHQTIRRPEDTEGSCASDSPDVAAKLASLIERYQSVIDSTPAPDVARLALKARFYLGRANLCLGLPQRNRGYFDKAETQFSLVTETYENALAAPPSLRCRLLMPVSLGNGCVAPVSPVVKGWAAEAYARRGQIRMNLLLSARSGNAPGTEQPRVEYATTAREAELYYRRAIDLTPDYARAAAYHVGLATIHAICEQNESARAALSTAVVIVPPATSPEPDKRATYEAFRQRVPAVTPTAPGRCVAGMAAPVLWAYKEDG